MKAKFILAIMTFSFMVQGRGQVKTKVFTLDLGEPHKEAIKAEDDNATRLVVKAKEPLAFRLVNGNPYKYKYVINHKLIDFFEGRGYNPLDSIAKKTVAGYGSEQASGYLGTEGSSGKIENIETEIKKLDQERIRLQENKRNGLKGGWDSQIKDRETRIARLKEELKSIKSQARPEYASRSAYSSNFINNVKLNNLLKTIKSKNTKDQEGDKANIKNASIVLKQAFDDLKIDINNYQSEIAAEDYLNQAEFANKRKEFNSSYIKLLQDLQGISSEADNFSEIADDFAKKTEQINAVSLKIKEEISKMYQLKLHNYLLPVDINGKNIDVIEVTIERYDKTAANPAADKNSYNIWVKGGLKIDISGGLFITSLMDREYETKDSGTGKLIYEKNKGNYDFGFGSAINISMRGGSWVRPGLSVGALFTANQKFQILSGLAVILGKEERIVLHGGLAMGTVSKISDNYRADGSAPYDLGTSGTIPTTNKFSFGNFFGVTYNFGKIKKEQGGK